MASSLTAFLLANPIDGSTKDIYPSKRFADAKQAFTIRIMNAHQLSEYRNRAELVARKNRSETVDGAELNMLIVEHHVVEPDFSDTKFLSELSCSRPRDAITKVLKAGEISNIAEAILRFSGFDPTEDYVTEVGKDSAKETGKPGSATSV